VLPEGFGNRLYKAAFLKRGEISVYDNDNITTETTSTGNAADEYNRITRLEAFFDGISNCGLRGTQQAVKVLVSCCQANSTVADEPMINANELVQFGYRIALSGAFLASANKNSEEQEEHDNDMARFLPAEDTLNEHQLQSFATSIVDHAKVRRTRSGLPPLPSTNSPEELYVSYDDIKNWVDDEAPLFAATLSTFIYRIFNPGQPYPPSRTEFVYPVIPTESAFFEAGSSTLLFVFACLSPALSGHVSSNVCIGCKGSLQLLIRRLHDVVPSTIHIFIRRPEL
jgi:hypothetical protein